MDTDRTVRNNLFTINWPQIVTTVISAAGLGLVILSYMASFTATQTQQTNDIAAIRDDRVKTAAAYMRERDVTQVAINKIPNLEYRITMVEAAVMAANSRIDRQTDAIGGLRNDIAAIGTKLEVLTTRIENAIPMKKSEVDGPFGEPSKELVLK